MRRVVLALIAALVGGGPACSSSLRWSGQQVFRYQGLRRGSGDIDRIQTQLRVSAEKDVGGGASLHLRLTGGPNEAPDLSFDEIRDFYGDLPLYADRYFVQWEQEESRLRLGRVPPPSRASELIYDADVNLDGLTASWTPGPWELHLSLTALHEISGFGDWQPAVGMVVNREVGRTRVGLGYHHLGSSHELARARLDGRLRGFDTNRTLQAPDADGDGIPEVTALSEFRLLELSAAAPLPFLGSGARGVLHLVKNLGADDRDRGGLLELRFPQALPRSTLILRGFRVEQDAVVSGYHGETLEGTNVEGLHAVVVRRLRERVDLRAWYVTTRGLDPWQGGVPTDVDEVRLDVIVRF